MTDRPSAGTTDELVLQLVPSPGTASEARRAVGDFCRSGSHETLADDASLLTSELVTNACRHSTSLVTVLALRNVASLVVAVTDDDAGSEPLRIAELDLERPTGRGLFLVDAIAGAWGSTAHTGGKSVWFRLP